MKKLLIVLLFVTKFCNGQDNSLFLSVDSLKGALIHTSHTWELQYTKDYDTIPAIMLVTNDADSIIVEINRFAFFIYGYKVDKYFYGGWEPGDYYLPAHREHYCYLDENKKPLKYRVWMAQ